MSEEEKKAIEKTLVETIHNYEEYYKGTETILSQISEDYKNANIILNLIDRLQKENNKLKKEIENIHHKSYNDIDYFNRDMRYDIDVLYDKFIKGESNR